MITAAEALEITESNERYQSAVRTYLDRTADDIKKAASNGERRCALSIPRMWPEFEAVRKTLIENGYTLTTKDCNYFDVNW